jgi:hypothetical protein
MARIYHTDAPSDRAARALGAAEMSSAFARAAEATARAGVPHARLY